MKFIIDKDVFLQPLQAAFGVVERQPKITILGNFLLVAKDNRLTVTGTDTEVELVAGVDVDLQKEGEITVPARKLVDICRTLPAGALVDFSLEGDRVIIRSGRSRFTLTTLSAADYPASDAPSDALELSFSQGQLKELIDLTQFAMAQQDVRYYLNGLLLETGKGTLRAVATDGHRLAFTELAMEAAGDDEIRQLIVPRKGVGELSRLLALSEDTVRMAIGTQSVQLDLDGIRMISKLIDGRFPDYGRVIPVAEKCDKHLVMSRDELRQGLVRASVLSNDKYRTVRLELAPGVLRLVANNPEQEEAQDELEVQYDGDSLEIGFNVAYLIEALGVLPSEQVRLSLTDANSSCLIRPGEEDSRCQYVVMPMRL